MVTKPVPWPSGRSVRALFTAWTTAPGPGSSGATARAVWRTRAVVVAAIAPRPHTSPSMKAHLPPGKGEDVVEVSADLEPFAGRMVVDGGFGGGQRGDPGQQQSRLKVTG